MNKDNNDNIILKKIDTNHFSIKLELMNKNNLEWNLKNLEKTWQKVK